MESFAIKKVNTQITEEDASIRGARVRGLCGVIMMKRINGSKMFKMNSAFISRWESAIGVSFMNYCHANFES